MSILGVTLRYCCPAPVLFAGVKQGTQESQWQPDSSPSWEDPGALYSTQKPGRLGTRDPNAPVASTPVGHSQGRGWPRPSAQNCTWASGCTIRPHSPATCCLRQGPIAEGNSSVCRTLHAKLYKPMASSSAPSVWSPAW